MDTMDEDMSARVLLKGVLHAELPKSPVTRSMARSLQQASRVRRSPRVRQSIPGTQSPQAALRKKMKDRLRESITRPPAQQKEAATFNWKGVSSARASPLSLIDDVTPRGLLRGILRTETESSPLVPDPTVRPVVRLGPTESSLYSNRPSTGTSDLDLPDLSTVNLTMAVRGISRKRPQRDIDLSTFERGLDQGADGIEGQKCDEADDQFSLSHGSDGPSVLSLKTPYADPQTERRGLRRAVKRRAVDVDDFEQGVQNRLAHKQNPDLEHSLAGAPGMLSETRGLEKFTLGITDLTVSDASDIIMSSTALYPHPISMPTADACTVTDKDTVTATQIQRGVEEGAGPQGEGEWGENHGSLREEEGERGDDGAAGEKDAMGVRSCENTMEEEGLMGEEDLGGEAGVNDEDAEVREEEALHEGGVDGADEEEGRDGSHGEEWDSEEEDEGITDKETTQDSKMAESEQEGVACLDISQGEDEEKLGVEHVARQRAYHSEGGAKLPEAAVWGRGFRSLCTPMRQPDTESNGTVETAGASAGWQSGPEEMSRSQALEGFPLPHSLHVEEPHSRSQAPEGSHPPHSSHVEEPHSRNQAPEDSPLPHSSHVEEPHSRRSLWRQEHSVSGTAAVTLRGSIRGSRHVQDKEKLSPSLQLESPEAEMSPPHPPFPALSHLDLEDEDGENEEQNGEDSDEDGFQSEELTMKTPAFVRQKKKTRTPGPATTPGFLKVVKNAQENPAAQPKRKRQAPAAKKEAGLPKSYLMSVFKHFAKTSVSSDVYPVLKEVMDKFFDRLSDDLEVYARHAKRKTIEVEDVELLLRRQGFVTDSMPVNVLIERYLPREYRKLLIPVATSGNKVVPKPRR